MVGASILLLLACGGTLIQARGYHHPNSNTNSNANVNILSRRNADIPGVALPAPEYLVPNIGLESMRRRIYDQHSPLIASIAVEAGEIAYTVTKDLADNFGETIAMVIAEEMATVLEGREKHLVRRNNNANSNTNIIGGGYGGSGGYGTALSEGPGGQAFGHGSSLGGIARARGTALRYADADEDEEEAEDVDEITKDIEMEADAEEQKEELELPASRSLGRGGRTWGFPIDFGFGKNTNSNANNNQINYRRNLRSGGRRNNNSNSNSNIVGRRYHRA